jgi:ornithine--oxo-acid transaminase
MNIIRRSFAKINLSKKAEELISKDHKYNAQNYAPLPIVIAKAEGAYVWDVDGKKYLDAICSFSAMNQGHLHPRIKNKIIEQMNYATLLGRGVYNDKLSDATEFLAKTFGYDRAILMNTGVEGGETAIKFARRWGYDVKGIPDNEGWILFATGNFWGRTLAACGSSDDPDRYHHFGPYGMNFKLLEYNNIQAFEKELEQNPNVAGIMLEPIQGEACVNIPSPDFLKKIRALCDKHKVMLIIDEVQAGLGRTGKLLCQEHFGIKGDLVVLGKALSGGFFPVSAVLGTEEAFKSIVPGSHGSTFGGNPLAAVTAIESVKVILEEGLVENSRVMGERLLNGLKKRLEGSKYVSNLRGKGLFVGMDINEQYGPKMKDILLEISSHGLLLKNPKATKIRVAPALTVNESDVDFIIETIGNVFGKYGK